MTMHTAVVGHPIAHSLSPLLHNTIYKNEGIDAEMRAIDFERVEDAVDYIRKTPLFLTAVTLPHKQVIMPFLEEIDAAARDIGAVNTVINKDNVLHGYNTDVVGIAFALKDVELKGKDVLIIGSGGAAQPLAYHLAQRGARIFCTSREYAKAQDLCTRYNGTALTSIDDRVYDVVINATPLGLKEGDPLPIPIERITDTTVVFDLIYTPTPLQRLSKERGARVITGLPMFLAQGIEQENIWLGRKIQDSGYSALLQNYLDAKHTL